MGKIKLLTKELKKKLPALYKQEDVRDPMVYIRFFHPLSILVWYATEYSPKEKVFFGLVDGFEAEFRYFSLDEMDVMKVKGLGIERDLRFKPKKLSKSLEEDNRKELIERLGLKKER